MPIMPEKKTIKKTSAKPLKEELATPKTPKKEKLAKPLVDKSLFAVISTGGKQYKVSIGDKLKIEKIKGEYTEGQKLVFDKVLLVDDGKDTSIGTPYIEGAKVEGNLEKIGRAKKVEVVKYRAKSNYFKRRGHRQPFFEVKITAIK